jgi:hypothetical protein
MNDFFLYRIDEQGDATIYGKFPTLSQAKLSASLLLIKDFCFILTGDMNKIYFYDEKDGWDYDVMTQKGKLDFLDIYPNPKDYK